MKSGQHERDELYILECLALARRGAGSVSPNPMVGAIVVKNGEVIGRGYHEEFGGPHAEVDAIRNAGRGVRGGTLYVNLEPCCHHGKTPPCTDLIIRSGIARVVTGTADPNPLVGGRGLRALRRAGLDVRTGVLREECMRLNEVFFHYIRTRRPFVTLKIAQTLDGMIADAGGVSRWVSSRESRRLVHRLRSETDAILIGAGTVKRDDPELTVRHVRGRHPVRVILDGRLSIPLASRIAATSGTFRTIVICDSISMVRKHRKARMLQDKGILTIGLRCRSRGMLDLSDVLNTLGALGMSSVLVEGGATLYSAFLAKKCTDKVLMFQAPKILGGGLNSFARLDPRPLRNAVSGRIASVRLYHGDVLIEWYVNA